MEKLNTKHAWPSEGVEEVGDVGAVAMEGAAAVGGEVEQDDGRREDSEREYASPCPGSHDGYWLLQKQKQL